MFIIVVGCGRLGSSLARRLADAGHEVAVVDWSAASFDRLEDKPEIEKVLGTGIDVDVLREAGVERCAALAAVTDNDNANIMIAQAAEQVFHVAHVVARVNEPSTEELLRRFGIASVCPTQLAARKVFDALSEAGMQAQP